MPSINLAVLGGNVDFNSTVLPESPIYTMGGPYMTVQVTKRVASDTGSVTIFVTNQEDAPFDWQELATITVGDPPDTITTPYAYFKFVFTGSGRLNSVYTDANTNTSTSTGSTGGGSGGSADLSSLGTAAYLNHGSAGGLILQAATMQTVKNLLQIGTASTLNYGATGKVVLETPDLASLKTFLGLGTASQQDAGSFGSGLMLTETAAAARTLLALGGAATTNFGNFGYTLSQTTDAQSARTALGLSNTATLTASTVATNIIQASDAPAIRGLLGLGSIATQNSSTFFNSLLNSADAATFKNTLGLGTAAAMNATTIGTSIIQATDAATVRTLLSLGDVATKNASTIGTNILQATDAGTVKSLLGLGSVANLNASTIGTNILQATDATTVKSLIGLSNVPASFGTLGGSICAQNDAATTRTLLGLTDLAITTPSTVGTALVTASTAANARTTLALGGAATLSVGTVAGTVAAGDHTHSTYLPFAGGTLTGALTLAADPVVALGAATKQYVDNSVSAVPSKIKCAVATTANITLSGLQAIDGYTTLAGDRVLVKNQTNAYENGIYLANASTWTRSSDADTWNDLANAETYIINGTLNGNDRYVSTSALTGTLGTTSITFVKINQLNAGTGIALTTGTSSTVSLSASGVTAGTYTKLTVDTYGRATVGAPLAASDITTALTYTPVNAASPFVTTKFGYTTGAGGTVTQATSKGTAVALNKPCGTITTANVALAANASVGFTLTNTTIEVGDTVIVHRVSGGTAGAYRVFVDSVAAGSCVIYIENTTAAALTEQPVIRFAVIKAVTA